MTRRCEMSAFARWAEYADERRAMRVLVARVFGRLVNGEIAKGFGGWHRACAKLRDAEAAASREAERQQLLLARFGAKLRNACANRAMQTWVETIAMWRWQRATMERCRARMMRRCEMSAFARWAEYVDERRAMRALVARVFGRLVNGETAKGFNGWRRACAKMRDTEAAAAARAERDALQRSFALARQKAALNAAMRLFGDLQRRVLAAWALHVREAKRQQLVLARFGAKLRRAGVYRALATWVEYGQRRRYYRGLLARIFGGRDELLLAAGWRSWRAADAARD